MGEFRESDFRSAEGKPIEANPEELSQLAVTLGIVLPRLEAYRSLIHTLTQHSEIAEVEFTYGAPLFKATPEIVEGLRNATSQLDRFDVYFSYGILHEPTRVRLAQRFRQRYLNRHPFSEGSDVFAASADVLQFRFRIDEPRHLAAPNKAMASIQREPHDERIVQQILSREPIDRAHLTGRLKLFLDHIYNPRRAALPEVQKVMTGSRTHSPVIVELEMDGALPGLFWHVLEPRVDEVDGAMVWLPG